MTDRTRPRLLAISPIPPDLRAALAQRTACRSRRRWRDAVRAGFRHRGDDGHVRRRRGADGRAAGPQAGRLQRRRARRIDLAEARARGIAVCHTPDELAEDVADGAIALTYAIMRRVVEADRFVRAGRWLKERMAPSRRLAGKTMGIVGLGRIGRRIADRADGDRHEGRLLRPQRRSRTCPIRSSPTCWRSPSRPTCWCSLSGGEATHHLVDRAVLERLGPRRLPGQRVARLGGRRAGAARCAGETARSPARRSTCSPREPNIDPRFLALDNVVLQPHSASITHETRAAMVGAPARRHRRPSSPAGRSTMRPRADGARPGG